MKKLAFGTLMMAGLLAACGGGDDGVTPLPDANTTQIDAGTTSACNPLSPPGMQGCATGQKCTWIQVQDTPESLGKLGCVPDGTVASGGTCAPGAVGETTGYDNCAAGNICINMTCTDICGFDGSANAACAAGFNCTRYADLFANGEDDPVAGACNPGCNPVTQIQTGTNPPSGCAAGRGCYLLTSQTETVAVCAGAGTTAVNTDITGVVYANSCVPGAQPRSKGTGVTGTECGGLCNPSDTMTTNMTAEGGLELTVPAGAKDNCQTSWAAPPASDTTAGESCRFWWAREPFDGIGAFSNSVGWCLQHNQLMYDTNADMTPDATFPRCLGLTTGDVVLPINNPPRSDAQDFWCASLPAMLQTAGDNVKKWHARQQPKMDRLAPPR